MARWIVLGAGSILPRAGHGCAGYALEREPGAPLTLFDCGPGTLRALGELGFGVETVERVVLSHFHPDHCLDLFALLFARRNPSLDGLADLELVGPVGLAELVSSGQAAFGRWVEPVRTTCVEIEVDDEVCGALTRGPLELACVKTGHTPNALAWRADFDGLSVVFSGDTGEVDAVADLARGVDLFTLECSFPDDAAVPHHLTPSSAGRLARRSGCRRLLLTHFYPGLEPEEARRVAAEVFAGPIDVARDGFVHAWTAPAGGSA